MAKMRKKTVDEQVMELEQKNLEVIKKLAELNLQRKEIEKKVRELKKTEDTLKSELLETGVLSIGEIYDFGDITLKTNKAITPVIDSLAVFRKLSSSLKKNELKEVFSQIFSVNKTNLRKYLSEKDISDCIVEEKVSYRIDAKRKK